MWASHLGTQPGIARSFVPSGEAPASGALSLSSLPSSPGTTSPQCHSSHSPSSESAGTTSVPSERDMLPRVSFSGGWAGFGNRHTKYTVQVTMQCTVKGHQETWVVAMPLVLSLFVELRLTPKEHTHFNEV